MTRPPSLGALLNADDDPADSPEGRRTAKQAVKRWLKAIAAKDAAALRDAACDEVIYEIMLSESGLTRDDSHRRFVGADAVIAFWEGTFGSGITGVGFDDVELSITGDGGRLFIEQRGDLVMADGKPYRNRYVFRFDIRDGKISHIREYFNPVTAAYAFARTIAGKFVIDEL